MRRRLSSRFPGVDRLTISVHYVVIDSVFDIRRLVGRTEDPLRIGLIFCEEKFGISFAVQVALTQIGMRGCNRLRTLPARDLL